MYPIIIKEVSVLIIGAMIVLGGLAFPGKSISNLGFDDGNYKGKWKNYQIEAKVEKEEAKSNINGDKVSRLVIRRNGKVIARFITEERENGLRGRWIKRPKADTIDRKIVDNIIDQLESKNLSRQTYDTIIDNKVKELTKPYTKNINKSIPKMNFFK